MFLFLFGLAIGLAVSVLRDCRPLDRTPPERELANLDAYQAALSEWPHNPSTSLVVAIRRAPL